jgi:hypothetical protein
VGGLIQINRAHLRRILQTGNSVIVDATFLGHAHRSAFFAMASRFGVPARILDFRAAPSVLAARIAARSHGPRDASDADLSTFRLQLASADLLTYEERLLTFPFDTAVPLATFCAGCSGAKAEIAAMEHHGFAADLIQQALRGKLDFHAVRNERIHQVLLSRGPRAEMIFKRFCCDGAPHRTIVDERGEAQREIRCAVLRRA